MTTAPEVRIVLKDGPVVLPTLHGAGVDNRVHLWNGISGCEFYPAGVDSAFYVITLTKTVGDPADVFTVEAELLSTLRLIAACWPFAGGSFVVFESVETIRTSRFESNAKDVHRELLSQMGRTAVGRSATIAYETIAAYRAPPLVIAAQIGKAAISNDSLRALLRYHQAAWEQYYARSRADRSSWFINLYKVRDVLKNVHGNDDRACAELRISSSEWSFFGRVLNNNDLRHAEMSGTPPAVPRTDVDRLYRLARDWTLAHLRFLGLPVADSSKDSA